MKNRTRKASKKIIHLPWTQIISLAKAANCDDSYVWMILNAKRPAHSAKAKSILRAAKVLCAGIEKATHRAERIIIGEND
jgi:hypothetical protein